MKHESARARETIDLRYLLDDELIDQDGFSARFSSKRRPRRMTVKRVSRAEERSSREKGPGLARARAKREMARDRARERTEEGQSKKERGPGAGPPGLLLREGGSSESIRTVSPADTHPPSTSPSSHPPARSVRRLVRSTPTGRPTTFSAAPQFSPLFPFITARRKVGGSTPEAGAAIFISLLPSISTSSFSSSFSFRLLHPPG